MAENVAPHAKATQCLPKLPGGSVCQSYWLAVFATTQPNTPTCTSRRPLPLANERLTQPSITNKHDDHGKSFNVGSHSPAQPEGLGSWQLDGDAVRERIYPA